MTLWLGPGIGYRRRYRTALHTDEFPDLGVLEITPDHFFAHPEELERLAEKWPLVFHDVGSSVATEGTTAESQARFRRVETLVRRVKPKLFSDHLALTVAPDGTEVGHLLPAWLTKTTLRRVSDRVRAWQDTLGVPVALENIALPFLIPEADYDEPDFLAELVHQTDCRLLLDLTNLLYNGRNFDFDPKARIHAYPLEAVVEVHLAGGFVKDGHWVDSHSTPVEEASYRLLEDLKGRAPLQTIIVERDGHLPELSELLKEAKQAEIRWKEGHL